jgi:hypothetical protein
LNQVQKLSHKWDASPSITKSSSLPVMRSTSWVVDPPSTPDLPSSLITSDIEEEEDQEEFHLLDDTDAWEIESIVDHRQVAGQTQYLVHWKPTWEPASNLQRGSPSMVQKYKNKHGL